MQKFKILEKKYDDGRIEFFVTKYHRWGKYMSMDLIESESFNNIEDCRKERDRLILNDKNLVEEKIHNN